MFPHGARPHASRAGGGRGPFPDHPALLAGDDALDVPRARRGRRRACVAHSVAQGSGAGDRVAVMTANRPEFVVAVNAISKLGASAVLLSPAWKALEVDARARGSPRRVRAVADGAAVELLSGRLGAGARGRPRRAGARPRRSDRGRADARPRTCAAPTTTPCWSSAPARPDLPKAVRHTHRSIGHATAHWCRGARPRARRPLPCGDAAVAHPRVAQPARGRGGGRHGAAASPVRPRRGALAGSRPSA